MQSQKSHSFRLFLWKNVFVVGAGLLTSFLGLNFNSNDASALYTPTLSASVDQASLQVSGNQVINSTNKTTEIPFSFTVNTNNRTGYTATLSAETENTALTNATSTSGAKINSISSAGSLGDFSNNTWGYEFGASSNYAPIPSTSTPAQILQTAGKTNGNEMNSIKIGMKLADNLESGNYTNKLILSFVSNPYTPIAIMTEGRDFNAKLKSLETTTNKIKHFKKSSTPPATTVNAKNIEDEDSDYEIKLWLDPADKTAYYYAEPEKVYLNENSRQMFYYEDPPAWYLDSVLKDILDIDLSNFDTSKVTRMDSMFEDMRNLTSLNLSNFDTSKVTDMSRMFLDMNNLTSLNLSNFDTSKVTDMSSMFHNMWNLASLNISNFNTSKVTRMDSMFDYTTHLTSLNLSNFDTSNVTNMRRMFCGTSNLTSLDISNFDTSNVTDMDEMFAGGYGDKLEKIYVNNDFNTAKLAHFSEMFANRKKLRGGNGSYLTNPSTADKTWLRVDRPGVQGYFTRKP